MERDEINMLREGQTMKVRINPKGDRTTKGGFLSVRVLKVVEVQPNNPSIIVQNIRFDGTVIRKLSLGGGIDRR